VGNKRFVTICGGGALFKGDWNKMNHSEALQLMATEKYLLDEFPPEMREQFEEHFFSCPECAVDVKMGAAFIENTKKALSRPSATAVVPATSPTPGWMAWLRPAWAIPAFAVLLAVIGYQAFVVRPALSNTIADLQKPQVLASAYLSSGTARGDSRPVVTANAGESFVLFVDIPADKRFNSYAAELLNPSGQKMWALTIPATTIESAKDSLPIRVAAADATPGEYVLLVSGLSDGTSAASQVARYVFEMKSR
jgi:hypothetical protein